VLVVEIGFRRRSAVAVGQGKTKSQINQLEKNGFTKLYKNKSYGMYMSTEWQSTDEPNKRWNACHEEEGR
jgi:hypothetical protein